MEVIRHGNTYKEVECKKCGALLSYCNEDVKHDIRYDKDFVEFHYSYRKYIICPECKNKIDISWTIDGEEQVK